MVLEVKELKMYYKTTRGEVKAVDGVGFSVEKGDVLGVVGESGCGKTSLALALMKLLPNNGRIVNGSIKIDGTEITDMSDSEIRRKIRWKKIAMVPQASMNSLNPVFRVGDQIAEVLIYHQGMDKKRALEAAASLLRSVGADPNRIKYYPHEFSGGMKQRAMIAMALALNPAILILDEPTTALDVLVQAGIIKLLESLRKEFNMSIILISHDLALVAQLSSHVAVMYAGKFVEYGTSKEVYLNPLHPYTIGLLRAFADIRKRKSELVSVPGNPPDLVKPPSGCRFHLRCPYAKEICTIEEPEFEMAFDNHYVACHFWKEIKERRS